jgi:hypothetical protein
VVPQDPRLSNHERDVSPLDDKGIGTSIQDPAVVIPFLHGLLIVSVASPSSVSILIPF